MTGRTITQKIINWFQKHKRRLPWRKNRDWYSIWISEVMLQQTQVETVIPYYIRFMEQYKTVADLAAAHEDQVLKSWEGLGYYSRARHLHQASKILINVHSGNLPAEKETLQKLPGFGPYTTNAVLSLAFNQPYGVVDGNVKRVISRIYALQDDINKPATHQKIQALIDKLLPDKNPGEFNEAMMDLGARVCVPKQPLCKKCPVSKECLAYQNNLTSHLPNKSKKPNIPTKLAVALIISSHEKFLIAKRPFRGMLNGLWEFPMISIEKLTGVRNIDQKAIENSLGIVVQLKENLRPVKHTYTHFHFRIFPKSGLVVTNNFTSDFYIDHHWADLKRIEDYPLHKAMRKILAQLG